MKRRSLIGLPAALLAILLMAQCSDDPSGVVPEVVERFSLNSPDTVTTGDPFTITVTAVGSAGTAPFTAFNGIALLTASAGSCSPESLHVINGVGSGEIVLSGSTDLQTITATCGAISGSIALNAAFMTGLPGDPNDSANEAIPAIDFVAHGDNYSSHPDLGDIPVSHNTIMLSVAIGTTVGQANALIAGINGKIVGGITGSDAVAPGVLFLRLPVTAHGELASIMENLSANPLVETVVQDALMGVNALPRPNAGDPADWTWESVPAGSNWGLESMRVPQLWNWNPAAGKQLAAAGSPPPSVLIPDDGFTADHPDVRLRLYHPCADATHGTFLAGVIGARFNNGIGVDGICPEVELIGKTVTVSIGGPADPYRDRISAGQAMISGIHQAMRSYASVVNLSMGYNWADAEVDSDADTLAQGICARQARLFVNAFHLGTFQYGAPLFVVSSGNDSGRGYGTQPAKYNSPMCYSALELGIENIIVVEAAQPGPAGNVEWWPFSNIGGHVSAPGDNVASTVSGGALYGSTIYGSSVAAAHVSGLAAYLLYLNSGLNSRDIRELIVSNAVEAGGSGAPFVDAWASAADIDRVRGGEAVLRMLCDIDDGTVDGNQRVLYEDRVDYDEEDADGDGGIGDGGVDMGDFRRWRDWYLASRAVDPVALGGAADHPKKDVNGDGEVGEPAKEHVYPRGDFNGDGMLDPAALSYVPGAIGGSASDIDVLRRVFDDPDYQEWELPGLAESGDVEIHAGALLSGYGAGQATVTLRNGTSLVRTKVISNSAPKVVVTVPVASGGYTITLAVSGTAGSAAYEFGGKVFALSPGDDMWLAPMPFIHINPAGSYVHVCSEETPTNALALDLHAHGITPGQHILLDPMGSFVAGGGYIDAEMSAVFSADSRILGPELLNRIPGAIDAGTDYASGVTFGCNGEPTDIPEDFLCSPYVIVKVPQGARYLFIAAADCKYEDNEDEDGDYGVQITKILTEDMD